MKTVNLADKGKKLRVLAYGKPGSGKTTFIGSAGNDVRTAPVLHVDCSGNPESLNRYDALNTTIVTLDALAELNPIYEWLKAGQPDNHNLVTRLGLTPGYKTLVFDGITAIQRYSFDTVLGTTDHKPGTVPAKASWDNYRSVLSQMIKIATSFYQTLDMHVLMTALEHTKRKQRDPNDSDTAYDYAHPALQGQSADELPGEALAVLRLTHITTMTPQQQVAIKAQTPDVYSVAQFVPTQTVYAKDQHGFGVQILGNPTVTALLDRLEKRL